MNLHEIGLKHKTDKSYLHNFTKVYEQHLEKYRDLQINFMEIGVLNGSSIKMWYEYLTNAKIYGVDLSLNPHLDNDRITTLSANQENEEDLKKLPNNLDIILDDGGHTMKQQQLTFKILFKEHLKSGGIYIIEDLHTSNYNLLHTYEATPKNNTMRMLNELNTKNFTNDSEFYINREELISISEQIESIEIFVINVGSITSIIRKK